MNLEELQIKIGIELKELNKQLKKASDDINDVLGPKATKKMMQDNNKVVKDGFKDMEKTAKTSAKQMRKEVAKEFESMSKDISKSLNKAFELDMSKFNKNLTQSMNDAKTTVRSACNDIRRELNAALNIKANVRVNSSVSSSGSNATSRTSDAAAIMQSSQYTGAMITKAVNEMIRTNNANTARLESSIRRIESALASEIGKLGAKLQTSNDKARSTSSNKGMTSSTEHKVNVKADIETSVRVVESDLQSEVNKAINSLDVSDIKTSLVLDENIKDEVEKAVNTVKAEDIKLKADLETNINLNKDELQNDVNKAIREVTTRDIEASIKVDNSNLQNEVDDAIRDVDIPELNAIIELEEYLQNDVNKAVREVDVPNFKTIIKLSESSQSELQSEVNNLTSKVTVPDFIASFEVDGSALQSNVNDIISKITIPDLAVPLRLDDYVFQFGVKDISKIMVPDLVVSFKLDRDSVRTLQTNVNDAIKQIKVPKLTVELEATQLKGKDNITEPEKVQAKPQEDQISSLPVLTDAQRMINTIKDSLKGISLQEVLGKTSFDTSEWDILEAAIIKVNKASENFESTLSELQWTLDPRVAEETNSVLQDWVKPLEESLSIVNKIGEELKSISSSSIDTTNLKTQVEILSESYKDLMDACKKGDVPAIAKMFHQDAPKTSEGDRQYPPAPPKKSTGTSSKKGRPPRPTIDKHNSPRPPEDYLSITMDDEPDDIFDDFNKQVDSGIEIIKNKLGDLNKLYSSLFNRSFIGQTFKYDLDLVNKELDKAFTKVKELKGEIEKLSGSIGLTNSTERLNSSIQDKPQASIVMGDEEEFSEFGDKVSVEIKEIEKQLNHLKMMYSSLFGRSVIGQTFQGDLGIVNESLGKTYNKIENLKESMNELDNSMGFRNKFPQDQDPNSGLPMVIDNTIDDQFNGIRKDIEDAYDKLQAFNKAIADLFDYLQTPFPAKFAKSIGDVEELKSAISNLLGMNKFGPGLEGYRKQVEHDSEEIIKDIGKIYKALQTPFGDTPAAFKEVAMLRGIIKEMTGMEPGIELLNRKELKESLEDIRELCASLAKMDNESFKNAMPEIGSYEEAYAKFEEAKGYIQEGLNDPSATKEDKKFLKDYIKDIETIQKKIKEIQDEDIKIQAEIEAQINAEAISRGFKELYVKATMDAVKDDKKVQLPIDFELVAQGAENLRNLFDLPEFKEHAEALRDILKGIDLGDDLKVNLDLDELLKKLKSIKSIDDIDIDLSDLRTDLIKLAEEADKMRSKTEDEIEIKVIDDEVAKITELLKLLDKIQAQYNIKIDVDTNGQGPILGLPGSGNFTTGRGVGSGNFSTRPGGPVGSGGAGGGRYTRPGSGNFTAGGNGGGNDIPDIFSSSGSDPFDAHVVEHYRGVVIGKFKEIAAKIKDIMGKVSKNIKNGFKEGFKDVLKGTMSKLTGAFKSMWSKLSSIFKKGAKDCEKATNGLNLGIKDLIKTALSFSSLYGLFNLGKQAIQQSGMLAQSEAKLASLMNKRMGATKETFEAVKALVSEQAKLGVVSEAAMAKGAEQLSMYVHSAKALETLMPAIANMTARRGGFNATENDAEEVATQLGEAIREGSITPLEQSGIYLSEAEIKKFQALRTEEERAAYLAQVVADNIGNINQNLAQTPHGQIAQLKNNFQALLGTLGTLLVNVIQPIVKWLNVIVVAANNALKALGNMLGFDMTGGGLTGMDMGATPGSSGIDDTKESIDDTKNSLEEAEEAAEKFKGALMGFDEINILSDNSASKDAGSEELDPSDITPGEGGQLIPPEFKEGENIFTKFGEKMQAFLDEFLEPFKAAWDLLGDDLKAEWADLVESFRNACDSLASFLKSVWDNGGKEFVQHFAEIILAVAKAAMEIGGEILDSLARLWDHLDPSKNMHTQRLLDVLNEVSEKIRDFVLGLGDHFESLMANGGQDVLNAMGDCFMDLGAAAVNGLGVAIDALDGLIDHLDPAVNENTRNMLQALADMFHATGQAAWDFSELLKSALANGGQDLINAMGDCFVNLGETIARVITTSMESLSAFFDYVDPAKNDITQAMMKAWEEAFLAIGQAALQFAELFESVMDNGGQEVLNKLGDAFNSLVGLVGTCVQEISDAMNGLFEHLDPKTNEFTQGMLKAWSDAFASIAEMAQSIGDTISSVMDNGGQEVVNKLGDAFTSLAGLVGTAVQEISDAISGLYTHLDPKTNEFTQGMLKAWEDAFASIADLAEDIGEVLGSAMDNGGQEIVNAIGDLGVRIVGAFGKIVDEVADCVGELFKHLDPAENDIAKGALESFEYFVDSIGNFVDSLADALGTFMDNGGQEFVNNIGDIIAIIGDLALTIGGDILNTISTFMDSWLGHAVISTCATALELVSEVLKGLLEILEPLSPIISGVVTAIGGFIVAQKVVGFIQGIVTAFQAISGAGGVLALAQGGFTALWGVLAANPIAATVAAIVGIGTAIVALYNKCEGFREFIDGILAGFQDLFNELEEAFSTLLEDVRNIFGNVIDIIVGIFTGDGEKVGEAVRELIINIGDLLWDLSTSFVEIGWALIEGLVKGIWECIKAIPKLLAGIGEFVIDFFKGLFGIHSPSTVFADLGVNLIEGLVKGISDSIKTVTDAFTKVGKAISDATKDIAKNVSDKFKETKEAIEEKLEETKEVVSEKWKEMKQTVSEKAKETYEAARDNWKNIKDTVSERAKESYESARDKWDSIKQTVSEKAKESYEAARDKWADIKQVTTDRFGEAYETARDKFKDIRDTVKEKAGKTLEDVSTSWTKIKEDAGKKLEEIRTDAEKRYNDVKTTIVGKIKEAKDGILEKWEEVRTETNDSIQNVRETAEEKYEEIKEAVTDKLGKIKSDTESKWEEIKKNTGECVEKLRKDAEEKYAKIKESFTDTLEKTRSDMLTKWENIKSEAIAKATEMTNEATTKFGEIKKNFTDKLGEVKSALGPKWDNLKTQASDASSKVVSGFEQGLNKLSGAATRALDSAKTAVNTGLNKIGGLFKGLNWSLPKIKLSLPKLSISGSFSINPPSVPKFGLTWEQHARGGIIDGITPLGFTGNTMHIGGEAGKEMVVPLENTSFTSKIAKAMGQAVDNALARNYNSMNSNNNNGFNDNRDVVLQVDGREFARASINSINKLQRESGRTLLDI